MRVLVLAVGRLKQGAEADLCGRYRKRLAQAGRSVGLREFEVIEIRESRAPDPEKRKIEESIALATLIPDDAAVILLDESGDSLSSASLADLIKAERDAGRAALAFIIGGPDGLARSLRGKGARTLAFGAATWPHQLVRIMLLEQIYRAVTILAGHPYHRA
ncbi:MAG TPA: 23S rRNA (pseudouridine(1915)-N(3))-methyltransferase RlmH [Pseudorhodoplanes sp.]|jgi:23S rRNA (pseudouridine1915-N3)-methyltransferase|nr:23S rRNA (pseudouridine(1915)-N(3))-methyltransferase RlmH [Pseudorhodoplanes sp.]